tara:strand:- start:21961 stop:22929 length:969 start_codon:yes stop_codon:yes gene_type:complete
MKALIIGLGSIGRRHLSNLDALGVNSISIFRNKNKLDSKISHNGYEIFTNINEAMRKKYDLIIISNPTSLHDKYTKIALDAKCNVYIEKPISNKLDKINNFIEMQKKYKLCVQVGCQLRFHPHLEKIRKWIKSNKIGKIYSVVSDVGENLPDWHPWEDYTQSYASRKDLGGGVILTMIHEIDYLFWLFGPLKLQKAIGGKRSNLKIDVEDTAMLSLTGKKNVPIHLRMDYYRQTPSRTLNIIGEKGEIFWDYYKKKLSFSGVNNNNQNLKLDKNWDRNDLFISIMKDFLNGIKLKKEIRSPLSDGLDVLKIALEAKKEIGDL